MYNLSYDAENRLTTVSNAVTADFSYDGDGKRVKGTVAGVTTTYVGNYFEWTGSTSTMVKYYYAGSTRVAMRTGVGTNETGLLWLLGDHLGSTARVANANGTPYTNGEQRYKPWGEKRYPTIASGLPTTYRFTGERQETLLAPAGGEGLYWVGSRWLDPALGRWIQADSIVPDLYNPLDWDRFQYVRSNPIRYTDPTGHKICEEGNCVTGRPVSYGIRFRGKWDQEDQRAVIYAVIAVARKLSAYMNKEAGEEFKSVYGNVTFTMGDCDECGEGVSGYTYSRDDIRFNKLSDRSDLRRINHVVHELGHAFKAALHEITGIDVYGELRKKQASDPLFPDRETFVGESNEVGPYSGFASRQNEFTWQQSLKGYPREEFADQFLGWTYNTWANDPEGTARSDWMDQVMPGWIDKAKR